MQPVVFGALVRALLIVTLVAAAASPALADRFLDAISDAEKQLVTDLARGRVIEAKPFGANGNAGSLWKVKVEHEGRVRVALFKPRTFGDRDGWARTPMESAVYKLDRILGLDLVPPAIYRRNIDVGGMGKREGALVLFAEDGHGFEGVPEHEWNPRREVFSSDLRILQAISRDADNQNPHNILRAKHWLTGRYRLMKVDNEAAMRSGAYVQMTNHTPTWREITRFRRRTYERLKAMKFEELKDDVGEFMSDDEVRDWLKTRDGLVRYIDAQIAQRGEAAFFQDAELAFERRSKTGRAADSRFVKKFTRKVNRLGASVTFVAPEDARLKGAAARTLLSRKGMRVLVARGATRITLTEELVHVNQLRRMARRAGSVARLYDQMTAETRWARLAPAAMEAQAKRLSAIAAEGKDKTRVRSQAARYRRYLKQHGGDETLWRAVKAKKSRTGRGAAAAKPAAARRKASMVKAAKVKSRAARGRAVGR